MLPSKTPPDPKMIGLWKVGRTLGKGFSGHVRIARHSKTGQYAAIKIIPKGSLGSKISLNKLADEVEHSVLAVEREIVVMKLIDHPNIMKLYDVWETSSSLYLILEYVQGGELFEYLCNEGRRPTFEALDYFQQIICAVDYCHRFNIAHRDLKLENILIDQNSNIKVADFGMATWQDTSGGSLLKTSCGSPHYAAPEVISGKPYNGTASDIWSCGVILHALLVARLPFDDDDCPTLLHKISVGKFDMPSDIDPQAQDLIARMLTTDVKSRITMPEIMRHPFFLSRPLKNPDAMASNLDIDALAQPLRSRSAIDPDIFANLRTIWRDSDDPELVDALTSQEGNWQQGLYHLLADYRRKHSESRRVEEELIRARKQRKKAKTLDEAKALQAHLPPRSGAPTPRRARGNDHHMPHSAMSFIHVQYPGQSAPIIALSAASPGAPDPFDLSTIAVPDLADERMQAFFHQVADHLNVLQARVSEGTPRVGSDSQCPPLLKLPSMSSSSLLSSPVGVRSTNVRRVPSPFNEPPVGQSSTRPLSVRRKSKVAPPPIFAYDYGDNKENPIPITESDLINKDSPLLQPVPRMLPNEASNFHTPNHWPKSTRLRKNRPPPSPISPNFSEAGSSFSTPSSQGSSAPPKRWLDNVFKFKTATYNLLSRSDVHTTRSECRRLLMDMDLLVSLEDSEKLGVLKCRSIEAKEGNTMTQGVKSVKFRVEMQWPTPQLCSAGFLVSLHLIQEKGSLEAFKGINQQLARSWTLGYSQRMSELPSSSRYSSTAAVGA
ncbi:kinase-like domain-containing protein [Crepidotus variabilis]|uniref:non-specific serine/threonine protein kinase n=1 Tax=Crepidotus variabilis TaxID=179855 RepID=A0A9P6JLS4_9AGAR|nr:kinase-like domain-containing protein [Crepidotus variabilis]